MVPWGAAVLVFVGRCCEVVANVGGVGDASDMHGWGGLGGERCGECCSGAKVVWMAAKLVSQREKRGKPRWLHAEPLHLSDKDLSKLLVLISGRATVPGLNL
jgi:hypothetical protein